eukprot:gnl/MRDRNA2_/MRDRNA2_47390_c0_seq1.p1 gnl/MRDRNA2_/MRDRNA2_47390_c0~~gnl/MRDRNA2_/MRDRNA2_47390_c0_seq1.p1  ORF type:complete len:215 (-),score=29.11 gnl/MRDRNA2_/MRDRNA2_47390_c0_seq1:98-661(-)
MSRVRKLGLYWNVKITDKGLCKLLKAQPVSNQYLTELNLSGCRLIGDQTVQTVTRYMDLEFLDLTRCQNVTDIGLLVVCENLTSLRVLKLFAMSQLTKKAFVNLSRLILLEELDLCGCKIDDDSFIKYMKAAAPSKLQTLNLTWCVDLTDASVDSMCQHCHVLEWLSLFGNSNVTSGTIHALAKAPY